ncbi:J domain-containing protein [Pseudobutyrivibrio xylanivorans]|uniref:DnaJ domain-containing protein n=1 Tax=Pseudobutyrivibrio xylanivorans DSM 14809 TaxID=1123012 RepID=A0A1M6BPN8_PSEXY|nr:DnaJ domain-containing protein [Pseudobutyrivibrio xylanivorans]SHI50508.1 DnaJ domain-containing protein [Pseudobutyrivibrio xylanivorans DSM 14809]
MNKSQARKILGLDGTEDEKEVKKKYRKLMHENHPDSSGTDDSEAAAKINTAYELIMKSFGGVEKKKTTAKRKPKAKTWNAKENKNAYCVRPIFHEVEDFDGNSIGTIEIARGKYIWSKDEEFSLFLKSLYETSKELIDNARPSLFFEVPDVIKQKYLADITYLLTGQFIDSSLTLKELGVLDVDAYKIDAMVELDINVDTPKVGSTLYPAGISNHRLYLRNKGGEIIGYLSFKDDRLYYVIIPLLEQKKAQVKMVVADNTLKSRTRKKYVDLDLWIRLLETEISGIESTNLKIDELLNRYAKEGF